MSESKMNEAEIAAEREREPATLKAKRVYQAALQQLWENAVEAERRLFDLNNAAIEDISSSVAELRAGPSPIKPVDDELPFVAEQPMEDKTSEGCSWCGLPAAADDETEVIQFSRRRVEWMHADCAKLYEEDCEREHERFYVEKVLPYARGEPVDIGPGSVAEAKAKIAKELIAMNPSLVHPEMRKHLMAAVVAVGTQFYPAGTQFHPADERDDIPWLE